MSIIVNFAGVSLLKPGPYSRVRVVSGGLAQPQLGVMAIIGEADQGPAFSAESGLSAVTWSPNQFNAIRNKYVSGALVDGALIAFAPSGTDEIQGGAQQLITLKTNQSVAASFEIPPGGFYANYIGLLAHLDADTGVNFTNYASTLSPVPSLSGFVGSFNALLIKLDNDTGVNNTDYAATWTISGSPTYAGLITNFNGLLAELDTDTGVTSSDYTATYTQSTDSFYGTLTAKMPGSEGNNISSQIEAAGPQVIITVNDSVLGLTEISSAIGGQVVFTIQATEGSVSAATMSISATTLTTSLTGNVTSQNLNVKLSNFTTVGQLVEYLNSQNGYSAAIINSNQIAAPPSVLDQVSNVDILTLYSETRNVQDVVDFFNSSTLVDFTPEAVLGLPSVQPKTFLSGGALGATSQANFQACLDELLKVRANFVVPLFSQDAIDDIALGLTDAASTYSHASIRAAMKTHVAQTSTVKGKKERQAWVGIQGTYDDAKTASGNLGSARVALVFQQVDVQNGFGELYTAQPHMLAVVAAGMKAAAVVGLPNTFKLINVSGFSTKENDFDPETQADDAILANLTFVERAPGGGFRFVLDNSTYGLTADAWVYNRPSVLYAADTAAFTIRLNTEAFIGKRNSDVSSETIKNLMVGVLDGLRTAGIIVADKNTGGKGYKDLDIQITGSVVNITVTLALVEGIEFVLSDIAVQRAVS